MKLKSIKLNLLFLFSFLAILFSCKSQAKTEKKAESFTSIIGKKVTELDKAIWSIFQDSKNNYWFGSNGSGVYFFDGKTLTQFTKEDGLIGSQIRGIQEDKLGNIYFDTPDGISKFDGKTFKTLIPIFSSKNEWKSNTDDLWFKMSGDSNGVFRYDGKSLFHLKFPEQDLLKTYQKNLEDGAYSPYGIYSIYKDKKDKMWFGMLSAGVYMFDGDSLHWIVEKELTQFDDGRAPGICSIIEDKEGNFWLSNTLYHYKINDQKNTEFAYKKLEAFSNKNTELKMKLAYFMSAITDDKTSDLWLVTYSEGVWKYDGENVFNYKIKDGETDVLLYAIYKDNKGTIWLGTHNTGVYKFNGDLFEKFNPFEN